MGKGENPGMATVIGPKDYQWYGTSGVAGGKREDADEIARRRASPLTTQADKRISDLRIDVAGLRRELKIQESVLSTLRKKIINSESALAELLHQHGLPLDPGLQRPTQNNGPNLAKRARTTKPGKTKLKAKS